jgi:hypothetical protein
MRPPERGAPHIAGANRDVARLRARESSRERNTPEPLFPLPDSDAHRSAPEAICLGGLRQSEGDL